MNILNKIFDRFLVRRTFLILFVILVVCSCNKKQDKVEALLSQMTLEEKCGQLSCPIGFNFYGKEGDSLWLAEDFLGMMDTMPLGSCWAVLRADPWSRKTVETGLHPRESASRCFFAKRRLTVTWPWERPSFQRV